ncbi:MAG TPA: hypothetical protein VF980_19800, partial [Thermoanaerobaculia bacterium]
IVIWSTKLWRLASAAVAVAVIVLLFVSNPGTAFYEGMNPDATGYAGVPPRIVQDIEPSVQTAGARDVAFRIVAARALRRRTSDEDANRFWFDKARAFIDGYRDHAWTLTGRKARLLASGYDAFDTLEMFLANRDLRGVWIPWALLFPLAVVGALLTARRSLAVILYSILTALVPIAFGVTARMRNPLLVGAAILGGLAVPALLDVLHRNAFWAIVMIAFVVTAAVVLSLPDDLQREDEFLLAATHTASELAALGDFATAATWLPERAPAAPGDALHTVALRELAHTKSLPRSLSIAMALLQCGDAAGADEILQRLQSLDYRACRGAHAVSSVAYYRALALLELDRRDEARWQLAIARDEAAGDADVLALSSVLEQQPRFAEQLDRLHDPFTRDWALARASVAGGAEDIALRVAARAAAGCPEWFAPRGLR